MTDVTATSAKVKWEKPEDDGGVPIKEYEIEKLDTRTGKWVRVGKIPGNSPLTEFEVTGLNPGSEYKFRVTAVNDEGDSEPLESERPIIAKNPFGRFTKIFKQVSYARIVNRTAKFFGNEKKILRYLNFNSLKVSQCRSRVKYVKLTYTD